MSSRPPSRLKKSPWNLLLLVPLLMLVTPWYNSIDPTLGGMPFFYWAQFAWVPVGVACVAIVYVMTKDPVDTTDPDSAAPESVDGGSA